MIFSTRLPPLSNLILEIDRGWHLAKPLKSFETASEY